jgi:ABC-type branched-subunit amino acid transport system ATPase component
MKDDSPTTEVAMSDTTSWTPADIPALDGRRAVVTGANAGLGFAIARALAARPRLLMLDEPVAGLTSQEGMAMAGVIREVRDHFGCAVILVEHKMDVVMSTCDRITVMAVGAKIFEGLPAEVQSDAEVRRVYLGEA